MNISYRNLLQQPVFAEEHNFAAKMLARSMESENSLLIISRFYTLQQKVYLARCRRVKLLDSISQKAVRRRRSVVSPLPTATTHEEREIIEGKLISSQ